MSETAGNGTAGTAAGHIVEMPSRCPFGHGRALRRDPVAFYRRVSLAALATRLTDCRDPLRPWRRPFSWLFIAGPSDLERILATRHANFGKGELNRPFQRMLGNGLLTSEGELWRRQRRLLNPAFTRKRAVAAQAAVQEACSAMLARWRQPAPPGAGTRVELTHELAVLTMDVVWRVFLGRRIAVERLEALTARMHAALAYVTRASFGPRRLPSWIVTPADRRFLHDMDTVDEMVRAELATGREEEEGTGFLALLRAAAVGGGPEQARQLHDEVITLLHAGQNTLACLLSWTFILLSRHPTWEGAVAAEAADAKDAPSVEAMLDTATGRCILEALRLYPPAWGGVRETVAEETLSGQPVPAGALVVFSQYATHRHPELWDDPESFRPERFDDPGAFLRGCYRYIPFGAGPRRCIGEHFALAAAFTALRAVLREVRLEVDPSWNAGYRVLLDLEPRGPVPATAVPRG